MESMKKLQSAVQQTLQKESPNVAAQKTLQDKVQSEHAIESSSQLQKDSPPEKSKRPAYGTDPEIARKVLDKYQNVYNKMKPNVENHPDLKAGEKKKKLAHMDRLLKYHKEGVHIADHVSKIKQLPGGHKDLPAVFLSDGNSKLSKDGIISWNLPAGHSCPGKGDCFGFCYAMQGPQSWPAAMKKRYDNFGVAERDDFVPRMNQELSRWGTKGGKKSKMGDIVRVHDSGDFYSQDYVNKWAEVAKANPDKHFYAYTKAHHLDMSPLHSLPNFKLIQSVGGNQDHKIDPSKPHAFIFPSDEARKAAGYIDASESDMPAATIGNDKIGLVIHGIRSKEYDQKAYGKDLGKPEDKKLASSMPLAKSNGRYHLLGGEIPDVYRFDQPDAIHQLKNSRHLVDRMKYLRSHLGEGSYSSNMDHRIQDIKAMYADKQEPKIGDKIEQLKQKYAHLMKSEEDNLNKGVMSPGSTDDVFPKSFGALQLDGDLHNHSVMLHHMKLHQKHALQAKNPDSAKYHWGQVQQIHDHVHSLKKNALMGYGPQSMPMAPMGMSEKSGITEKMKRMSSCLKKTAPPPAPPPPMPTITKPKDPFKQKKPKNNTIKIMAPGVSVIAPPGTASPSIGKV